LGILGLEKRGAGSVLSYLRDGFRGLSADTIPTLVKFPATDQEALDATNM